MRKLLDASIAIMVGLILIASVPAFGQTGSETLYSPPWSDDVIDLAKSCKDLIPAECSTLRSIVKSAPHAYGITNETYLAEELINLHNTLYDAEKERRTPTVVIYSIPDRDCGGEARLNKIFTPKDYVAWADRIVDAIIAHASRIPINVIVEPHALDEVVTEKYKRCAGRDKSEVFSERVDLLHYVIWGLGVFKEQTKVRAYPNVRIFLDIGGPERITDARDTIELVRAINKILQTAMIDGVSVNVGDHAPFAESYAFAKQVIALMDYEPGLKKNLTVAIDIGRSGMPVASRCNAPDAALGTQLFKSEPGGPQVEVALIIQDPSESDGLAAGCDSDIPAGGYNMKTFMQYIRNTTRLRQSPAR